MNDKAPISADNAQVRKGRAPLWQRLLSGGLIGIIVALAGSISLVPHLPMAGGKLDVSLPQAIALTFSIIAVTVALILLIMSFSKRMYETENWSAEGDPDEHRMIAPQLRISALSMFALAVQFGVLCLPALPAYIGPIAAASFAAVAIQLWTGWRAWRDGDELLRAVSLEGSAIGLGLVFVILSLWAPFAVHGLVGFDPLAVLLVVAMACVVPTIWLTVRRGMAS